MPRYTFRLSAFIAASLILAAGCAQKQEEPVPWVLSPSLEPTLDQNRPDPIDFTDQAAQMMEWKDTCEVADPAPLIEQFANSRSVEYRTNEYPQLDKVAEAYYQHSCRATLRLDTGGYPNTYLTVEIFDDNLGAYDRYHQLSIRYPHIFSDAEVDELYDLGATSSWNAVQVTAQDTPTTASAGEVVTAAVMLGDFYTVELLVRFEPEREHQRADCEPDSEDDCAMTAAYIAEYLATSSYLEDLYASIEATFER